MSHRLFVIKDEHSLTLPPAVFVSKKLSPIPLSTTTVRHQPTVQHIQRKGLPLRR